MASYSDRRSAPRWRRNRAKSLVGAAAVDHFSLAPRTPARFKPSRLSERGRYWHMARVTKLSVRQSSGFRTRPGINTFAEQVSAESVFRLFPSLKPLAWQSLSAPALQSGAPLAETGHIMRPATREDGLARRDRLSPASFARAL